MLRRNFASWKCWVLITNEQNWSGKAESPSICASSLSEVHASSDRPRESSSRLRSIANSTKLEDILSQFDSSQTQSYFSRSSHGVLSFSVLLGISRRRSRREDAKEKIVRWWRHHRFRIRRRDSGGRNFRERERRVRALRDIQKFLKRNSTATQAESDSGDGQEDFVQGAAQVDQGEARDGEEHEARFKAPNRTHYGYEREVRRSRSQVEGFGVRATDAIIPPRACSTTTTASRGGTKETPRSTEDPNVLPSLSASREAAES
ncbi:hypothetical protein GQ600_8040 [Phytophthora cactorum]|nr:hypothetical protein GQ600_8040 [Phytophthora cactorum]